MNLQKQVEPLLSAALQASSNRGMHNARPRGSLGFNVGSDEPPKTITSKAGLVDLNVRSGEGQDALTACLTVICARTSSTICSRRSARSLNSPFTFDCS
jgi:hypothetical protein